MRLFAAVLSVLLCLPVPGFALRPQPDLAGLEESLSPTPKPGELDEIGEWVLDFVLKRYRIKRARALVKGTRWQYQGAAPAALRAASPQTSFPVRLDPSKWPGQLESSATIWGLEYDGRARIPLEGGEAVILLRQNQQGTVYLMFDLFLKPSGGPPLYMGKLDLVYQKDGTTYVAKGSAPTVSFSSAASRFLETEKIPEAGPASPFREVRSGPRLDWTALHIVPEAADKTGLSQWYWENVLALAAVKYLIYLGHIQWGVDKSYDNQTLTALVSSSLSGRIPPSKDNILFAPLANAEFILSKRLSPAGLEEVLPVPAALPFGEEMRVALYEVDRSV